MTRNSEDHCAICQAYNPIDADKGECRAEPPKYIEELKGSHWPTVGKFKWCGMFKKAE